MKYDTLQSIIDLLEQGITDEPENALRSGGIIRDGYDSTLDRYRSRISDSKSWLTEYQTSLTENYNFPCKIKYTSASGYFIEVSKTHVSKVPDEFVHTQTLVNATRFITQELKQFESELLEAQDLGADREYELFQEIRAEVLGEFELIKSCSTQISHIDFAVCGAICVNRYDYIRPDMHDGYDMQIRSGRHAVIEQGIGEFIHNDLHMDTKSLTHIITGPNMGGKSTFLRQNALIILLAHMGYFVPCDSAKISLVDAIFSRVGASDNLYKGQSTFMIEMQEVAHILQHSTSHSFVIIDEVGRGTSTYDGMSLAWAILKKNHDSIGAKTLFATHYHELVDESKKLGKVKNFSVSVGQQDGELIFLRKIISEAVKKSYGLEVARLAGISSDVIDEAREMMRLLEQEHTQMTIDFDATQQPNTVAHQEKSEIEKQIDAIDTDHLTPMEALHLVNKWKQISGK